MENLIIRAMSAADRADLLRAVTELQDYEARLHETRLSAAVSAAPYLDWMLRQVASQDGCCYLAYQAGDFAGFVAGWVERIDNPAETPDSTVSGYISDICVLPPWRRRGLAQHHLVAAARRIFVQRRSDACGSAACRQTRRPWPPMLPPASGLTSSPWKKRSTEPIRGYAGPAHVAIPLMIKKLSSIKAYCGAIKCAASCHLTG